MLTLREFWAQNVRPHRGLGRQPCRDPSTSLTSSSVASLSSPAGWRGHRSVNRTQNPVHQRPCSERPCQDSRTSPQQEGPAGGATPPPATQRPAEKMPGLSNPEADHVPGRVWTAMRPWAEQSPCMGSGLCDSGQELTVPGPLVLSECGSWTGGGTAKTVPVPASQPARTDRTSLLRPVSLEHPPKGSHFSDKPSGIYR